MTIYEVNARQARLVVGIYEWYWREIWIPSHVYAGRSVHLELLHTAYKDYREELPSFTCDSLAWVVLSMDRPSSFSTRPVNDSELAHSIHVRHVYELLAEKKKASGRRRYRNIHNQSQKWSKASEPSADEMQEQKEKREAKQVWREKSGKARDSRKARGQKWPRHPGRFNKKLRSRTYRQWTSGRLKAEDYDAFPLNIDDRKRFVDPWSWD